MSAFDKSMKESKLRKLVPWNWFRHEDREDGVIVPVRREVRHPSAPYGSLLSLHQDLDRLFDHLFRSFGMPLIQHGANAPWMDGAVLRPSVDISATDQEYRISVEVPGVEQEDLQLELCDDGVLRIRGEKKQAHEDRTHDAIRIERTYGAFERILAIPDDVDQDQISAQFKNGVLSIRLPRTAAGQVQTRRIAITSH